MHKRIVAHYQDKAGELQSVGKFVPEQDALRIVGRTIAYGLHRPCGDGGAVYVPFHRILEVVVMPSVMSAVELAAEHLETVGWEPSDGLGD